MPYGGYIKKITKWLAALALTPLLTSCLNDDLLGIGEGASPEDVITVSANVRPKTDTRGEYIEEGLIDKGTYYMVYNTKQGSSYYGHAFVDFGNPEGPTTGYAYFMDGDDMKELKWLRVNGEGSSKKTFYLTNLSTDRFSTYSPTSLMHYRFNNNDYPFGGGVNPFVAAPLDRVGGINDILVAQTQNVSAADGKINFELEHILSLLKVNIEVYPASDGFLLDLSEAEVSITNVCKTVSAIQLDYRKNFHYGTSTTTNSNENGGVYCDPGTLTLVEPDNAKIHWDPESSGPEAGHLDGSGKYVYSTYQFVMPPQSIPPSPMPALSDDFTGTRPKLVVKVPKSALTSGSGDLEGYTTFSGFIPDVMFGVDEFGNLTPQPETIAFRSGCQLNITATINSPETDLTFAPVTVEPWASKGSFSIMTKQAGIYNLKQFRNAVEAYNSGDMKELLRYGYEDGNGTFVFQIWANFGIDPDEFRGTMKPSVGNNVPESFCFLLNGYSLPYEDALGNETGVVLSGMQGALDLYNLFTGENEKFIGIKDTRTLQAIMRMFTEKEDPPMKELTRYVTISNLDNTMVLDFTGTFDIPFSDVVLKTGKTMWDYTIDMDYHGNKVYVTVGENAEAKIECPGETENYNRLYTLMVKGDKVSTYEVGIRTPEDFYFLVDLYNNYVPYDNNLLKVFGVYNTSNSWDLYENANMTLDGEKIIRQMIPDAAAGKPNFRISWAGSFTILHPKVPFTINTGNAYNSGTAITRVLQGTGAATSTTGMATVISNYNNKNYNNLWTYGYFYDDKWTFNMTYSSSTQTVPYTTIFGKMVPDESDGKYDFTFNLGSASMSVTAMPNTGPDDTTTSSHTFRQTQTASYSYPNTADDLKKLALGTYWEWYEEWQKSRNP